MHFIDTLNILSKSSSYAVSTKHDLDPDLAAVKSDLYVEMPIERDFRALLDNIDQDTKKVIFLCGSSGDGKSELLLRAKQNYEVPYIKFHLDATHSFAPHDSAVDTLNKLFREFEQSNYSLIVGINIGMLGNYAEEAESPELRRILKKYLVNSKNKKIEYCEFINFENYPKFKITHDGYEAEFISKLLAKITDKNSLLYKSFLDYKKKNYIVNFEKKTCTNYQLLCDENIQKVIIELLFKTRLFKNQFVTARNFLDFIYELICGGGYLFDNLFSHSDNEILENVKTFDPALLRSNTIDRFFIEFELGKFSLEFTGLIQYIKNYLSIDDLDSAISYIRLFYILKSSSLDNQYIQRFKEDFEDKQFFQYLNIYRLHKFYDVMSSKPLLKFFYSKDLVLALRSYINRKSPYLDDDEYLIEELGINQIIAKLKVNPDFTEIENNTETQPYTSFYAFLKVGSSKIDILIDINLFELLYKLKHGYRPSKSDRSVVVRLNKIINNLLQLANASNQLSIKIADETLRLTLTEDNEIEVAGIK